MQELPYYLSLTLTALLCTTALLIYKKKTRNGVLPETKAKNIYSLITVITGLCGGTLIFHALIRIFELFGASLNFGHGEILIAAIIYNLILGLIFLVVGRTIIGWKKFN